MEVLVVRLEVFVLLFCVFVLLAHRVGSLFFCFFFVSVLSLSQSSMYLAVCVCWNILISFRDVGL